MKRTSTLFPRGGQRAAAGEARRGLAGGAVARMLTACRAWLLVLLALTGSVAMAASCPYCGQVYGDPMPGDESRVYALRQQHEASCPSRPQGGGGGSYGGGGNIFEGLFRGLRERRAQQPSPQPGSRFSFGDLFRPPSSRAGGSELSAAAQKFEHLGKSAPAPPPVGGGRAVAAAPAKTGLFNRLFGRKSNPEDPGLKPAERIEAGSETSARQRLAAAGVHGQEALKARSDEEMKAKSGLGFDTPGRTPANAGSGTYLRKVMSGPSQNFLYRSELPKGIKLPRDVEQRRRALVKEREKALASYRATYLSYDKAKNDPVKHKQLEGELRSINRSVNETENKIKKEVSDAAEKDPQLKESLIKVLLVED
ncbi:hypothetical protein [Prosthecobacter sp.]|uniref:hypothetical protein n=1 Tax=Prosthecobacter sp. TaxID=1965333 RepID=UPI003784CC20